MNRFTAFAMDTEVIHSSECSATVTFFPLERGLGNTIGNTLRRLLLSSIPSAAVFAIRVGSLPHEFSAIKGCAEDVTQLIIAIKKLVLRIDENIMDFESLKSSPIEKWPFLKVRKNKVGPVYAKDIECFAGVEVVNPELKLCEITVEGTTLEIDLYCTVDRGYRSANENRELLNTLSLIPIDTLFSPVLLVDWKVSEEKTTKYGLSDKLKLSVSTNGSIKALDAVWYASKILISIFEKIAEQKVNLYKLDTKPLDTESKSLSSAKVSISSSPIEILELGQRTYNILKNGGINTVSELISHSFDELANLRNLGKKALIEIQEKLQEHGYTFRDGVDAKEV
ncbi:DNA-directed RNA polymerase subunit alpha [Candidatus Mycoplasma haematolamae str. Purdue]|uniref:DNA-directed RNA polymerase subunit alpha n=1 Tax=Mycoplasma haematolamae (strain Purdue) TaxID=1212765 RepID=I7C6G0_MYCHA|nr:DNA-directed RNA polymerase subunit alpha [Candidatus Mycoplasma haematolamae]AFO52097.1 DNA-directed RNA polymerase subunit alpha [Candidatus Mycoplasma haematolamae str. Purdue]